MKCQQWSFIHAFSRWEYHMPTCANSYVIFSVVCTFFLFNQVDFTYFICRYAACVLNGKKPSIQFALILKDTFGCMPGYKFNYVSTTLKKIYTVPVCTEQGWLEQPGGLHRRLPVLFVRRSESSHNVYLWLALYNIAISHYLDKATIGCV